VDAPRRSGPAAIRRGAQDLEVLSRLGIVRELGGARRVELELARIDDQVDADELRQLLEFRRRALGLHGPAPREQVDVAHAAGAQGGERVVGDVGRREPLGIAPEHARDVDRHVADADHRRRGDPRSTDNPRKSGWRQYQATKAVDERLFARSSPGTPSRRSLWPPTAKTTWS
jgi:hypothetical protein